VLSKEDLSKRAKDAGYTYRGSFEVSKALVISDPLFTATDPFEEESKNHLAMCHPGRWHLFSKDDPNSTFGSEISPAIITCHDSKIRDFESLVTKLKPCAEILVSSKSIAILDSVLSKDEDFIQELTESELNKLVQDKAFVFPTAGNGWFEVSCDNFGQKNCMLSIFVYESKKESLLN